MPRVENVSDTAFMVAAFRAIETARADALFRDPLAARLAGERGKAIAESIANIPLRGWPVVVRTVIIDEVVRAALPHIDTVLNLGAGLDTRPYRLDLPSTLRWIEVDLAPVIEWKQERLRDEQPTCALEQVSCDLTDRAARRAQFDEACAPGHRVLVITEGVVPYLSVEEVGALADDLRAHDTVFGWIVDYISPRVHRYRERSGHAMANAPFKFQPADWFEFFGSHGWQVREMHELAAEGVRRGRPIPLPTPIRLLARLLTALRGKRRPHGGFAGYAVLEPTGPAGAAPTAVPPSG